MNTQKLSVNRACVAIVSFLILLSVVQFCIVYLLTDNRMLILCGLLYIALVLLSVFVFISIIRRKLILFSDTFCELLDNMMTGEMEPIQAAEEESLFYKINHRLVRLYEVMIENRNSVAKERADLQELISDISHQVKTPITNLKMVNATLLEQSMPEERYKRFFRDSGVQLDKLDFLMQAMIKTSRLETGVISLEKKVQPIYDTLAAALGGILLNAEKKNIHISVECPEELKVSHDRKWTSEALFNILDNAVKYTPDDGNIYITVASWEFYLKIDISDTGKGIPEKLHGTIFKRFYREDEVHDIEGIGIGLYLAREIIAMQGGYIKVASEVGKGSTFSIFLPHK